MTLKETSLDDIAEEVDYAVFEAHQWALEEHLSIRRLIAEQECCVLDEFHGSANEWNGEKGSETREWLVKAKRTEEQLSKFLVKAAQVQQMVQENTALEAAEEVEFLQTKTIPTQEAMQELEKWREPLSDEVTSLVKELEVVEPTTQEKLDKLAEEPNAPVIEYVPSLVVFTRKQGTGRRRARICACGNFISSTAATEYEGPRSLSRHSLYAPGLDSTTFRCQVRHAAYMVWIIAGLDISKAFLTAPMNRAQREGRLVVVQPPRAAVKLGLCTKEERWIVRKALYGLAESPAAWVEWRDQRLQGMSWVSKDGQAMSFQRSNADPSLFLIMAQEKPEGASKLVGTMGLYVGDFLMAGPDLVSKWQLLSQPGGLRERSAEPKRVSD